MAKTSCMQSCLLAMRCNLNQSEKRKCSKDFYWRQICFALSFISPCLATHKLTEHWPPLATIDLVSLSSVDDIQPPLSITYCSHRPQNQQIYNYETCDLQCRSLFLWDFRFDSERPKLWNTTPIRTLKLTCQEIRFFCCIHHQCLYYHIHVQRAQGSTWDPHCSWRHVSACTRVLDPMRFIKEGVKYISSYWICSPYFLALFSPLYISLPEPEIQ